MLELLLSFGHWYGHLFRGMVTEATLDETLDRTKLRGIVGAKLGNCTVQDYYYLLAIGMRYTWGRIWNLTF
jgi:hypothetical protein